ncbi:GNAT family N-acetyltransferase [Sporomusa sphaeroides]|uniref:N-acetyltransferase domain-containing protein n=1 Tax=Sporomusa sphaeroides DSM 2875 TaxID=1337886 RepID=A0ABP2CBH4_9FIRM|nr:GNAT family N-acetyltransferase [Sporomusa sphaeroides]OLS54833.1 hypothetical protein SPSPH_41660 [Sporomusa sphaeroides DSM 2875]CVK21620.1 hypothetical protein SSPH_04312 [Sporomusa sphaeroides DSM 2875]
MRNVKIVDLTATKYEEALAVFRRSDWDETSLMYVKAEMKAFLKGDIAGYVRAHFVAATVDGSIIGVAAWAPSMCAFSVYELSWATVLPEWRHRGVNTLMLQERIEKIKAHHGEGRFTVLVYTWVNPMYARAGFVPVTANGERFVDNKGKCMMLAQFAG